MKNTKQPLDELSPCPFEIDPKAYNRFTDKFAITEGGCWLWHGAKNSRGYGHMAFQGKNILAHRLSYLIHVGAIPAGLTLDHLCNIRNCINPKHLEPVTQKVNNLRSNGFTAVNKRKTHCVNGHPLIGNHIRIVELPDGIRRVCKTCRVLRARKKPNQSEANGDKRGM